MAGDIKVRAPDGTLISFPEGTPPEQIEAVMRDYTAQGGQNIQPVVPGDVDPVIARAQQNLAEWDRRMAGMDDAARRMLPPMTQREATVAGLGRFANSAFLGFGDEAAGVGGGIVDMFRPEGSFARGYERTRDDVRQTLNRFGEEYPDTALGLDIAGGLVPVTPAFLGAGRAATGLGRSARVGAVGAGYGAAAGFGSGEGGIDNRIASGLTGAAIGGVTGAALPPTLNAIGAIGRAGGDFGRNLLGRAGNAMDRVRGRPPSWNRAADDGERLVLQGMGRDNFVPVPGRPILEQLTGKQPNTEALARAIWATPGQGRARISMFFDDAQAKQHETLLAEAARALRADDRAFYTSLERLDEARRATAFPAYREMWDQVGIVTDPRVIAEMNRPEMRRAMDNALAMLAREDIPAGQLVMRAPDGRVTGYHMQLLDYTKRGLDDMVRRVADRPNEHRSFTMLTQRFRDELDRVSTVEGRSLYRNARDLWSGPTGSMEAAEAGRLAWSRGRNADLIEREMAALPEADREFYRMGAMRALADEVGKLSDNRDAAGRFLSVFNRRRLATLIGDNASSNEMFGELDRLFRIAGADRRIRGGSSTAPTQAGMDDVLDTVRAPGETTLGYVGRLARGEGPINAAFGVFAQNMERGIARRMGLGRWRTQNPRVQGAMEGAARILTGGEVAQGAGYMTRIAERAAAEGARQGRRYRRTRGLGGLGGATMGNDGD